VVTRTQGNDVPQNDTFWFTNNGTRVAIGCSFHNGDFNPSSFFNGYATEIHTIDGQVVAPTDFAEFDANDVWVPREYAGTYGANGFYLDFSDPDDIGADRSGNGNNFNDNGFELGDNTSVLWDHMEDSPTQNFATANPLLADSNNAYREGNQYMVNQNPAFGWESSTSTIKAREGRFYFEVTDFAIGDDATGAFVIGVGQDEAADNHIGSSATSWAYRSNGQVTTNGTSTNYGTAYGNGNVLAAALDLDNGTLRFFLDGVDQGIAATGIPAGEYTFWFTNRDDHSDVHVNYGQRPFRFAPPAGFEPLQTQELPAAPIPNGRDHFQAITDTGANILTAAQTAFPNGLWWIKDRVNSNQHQLVDSVRGGNLALQSPAAGQETAYVAPAGNSVAWCWSAPDTWASTDADVTAGTIASNGRRNAVAGFSIIEFTGNETPNSSVGHGLNQAPEFVITKKLDSAGNFNTYHASAGSTHYLVLNLPDQAFDDSNMYNGTTNTVVNIGSYNAINANGEDMIMYAWHSVPGYSAFGSYQGNNDPQGVFVPLSFRPAFVLIKSTTLTNGSWVIMDSTRNPTNPANLALFANLTDTATPNVVQIDLLSNGMKMRNVTSSHNQSGGYIYAAFAENPFGSSNTSPATAR
jgi:hypothetical protein